MIGQWWMRWTEGRVLLGALPPPVPWQSARVLHPGTMTPRTSRCFLVWTLTCLVLLILFIILLSCNLLPRAKAENVLNVGTVSLEETQGSPPVIQAMMQVIKEQQDDPGKGVGAFMDQVEQKELMIQESDDKPEKVKLGIQESGDKPEKVKLGMLIGNPHSYSKSPSEKELQKLAIPTRYFLGHKQYKLKSGWWTPPRWNKQAMVYLDPLPFTGAYDEQGIRWVNHEGQRRKWGTLPFLERLKRMRKPWCMVPKKDKDAILKSLKPTISRLSSNYQKIGIQKTIADPRAAEHITSLVSRDPDSFAPY